jgi:hypothetical protein
MEESVPAGGSAFREWMRPTVESLNAFTDAIEDAAVRHDTAPDADSQAMGELAAEDTYRSRCGWRNPVADTHSFGAMTLLASVDCTRTFAAAFATGHPPLYGHLVLARAALESSVVAWWLNEHEVAYETRVKRGLCEMLYSAREEKLLGLTPTAAQILAEREDYAAGLGWNLHWARGGKPVVDGERRPRPEAGITGLVVSDPGAQLGKALWSRLSAVNHVAWWGLQWAQELPEAPLEATGSTSVATRADSRQVVAVQALCIVRALRASANERFKLMGWVDEAWTAALGACKTCESSLLAAATGSG